MRIGIDARFLTHPQRGGFKTYTRNLIMAMNEVDDLNDYFVYVDRPSVEVDVPQKENWHIKVVYVPLPVLGMPLREQIYLKRQFINDRLDIVHFLCNTAPVNLKQLYVVTLHDTIQVTAKKRFPFFRSLTAHKNWAITAYSKWAINNSIRSAERIITVSSYEKEEICKQFNIPSDRISAIHLAPDPRFKPAKDSEKNIWRSDLSKEFGINKKFIFGVGYEARKNVELLIESFSKLSYEENDLDLVVVCADERKRLFFQHMLQQKNLTERAHILGSMRPESLVVLYNLAEAFIYPSERESFGLPPLEAISCGTPTAAMKKSSVPEVLGKAALYVDGKDVQSWTNSIKRILTDKSLRLQLIDDGLKQASKFIWQKCARETIQVYRDILCE